MRRRLGRLWDIVETDDDVPADADIRIKANAARRSLLEASLKEAQSILSQRKSVKSDSETITALAQEMGEFLRESELSERKAFAETFVREIVVMPGKAVIHYAVTMPGDSHMPGADSEEVPLDGSAKPASKTPVSRAERNCTTERLGVSIKVSWSVRAYPGKAKFVRSTGC